MRTSLAKIKEQDDFLSGRLSPEEEALFQAKLIIDAPLRLDLFLLKRTLALVQLFSRRQLRAEIEQVHETLFSGAEHADFQQQVREIFPNH
jgi:hypothetical protein